MKDKINYIIYYGYIMFLTGLFATNVTSLTYLLIFIFGIIFGTGYMIYLENEN